MAKWMITSDHVALEVRKRVARITLNRPKKDFDADVAALGFKAAVRKRDEPFGDGVARPSW